MLARTRVRIGHRLAVGYRTYYLTRQREVKGDGFMLGCSFVVPLSVVIDVCTVIFLQFDDKCLCCLTRYDKA